jgi:hypothetical protein
MLGETGPAFCILRESEWNTKHKVGHKVLIFRSLASCCPLVSCPAEFLPWRWRRYVPPKRRFTYGLHGSISYPVCISYKMLGWSYRWQIERRGKEFLFLWINIALCNLGKNSLVVFTLHDSTPVCACIVAMAVLHNSNPRSQLSLITQINF